LPDPRETSEIFSSRGDLPTLRRSLSVNDTAANACDVFTRFRGFVLLLERFSDANALYVLETVRFLCLLLPAFPNQSRMRKNAVDHFEKNYHPSNSECQKGFYERYSICIINHGRQSTILGDNECAKMIKSIDRAIRNNWSSRDASPFEIRSSNIAQEAGRHCAHVATFLNK